MQAETLASSVKQEKLLFGSVTFHPWTRGLLQERRARIRDRTVVSNLLPWQAWEFSAQFKGRGEMVKDRSHLEGLQLKCLCASSLEFECCRISSGNYFNNVLKSQWYHEDSWIGMVVTSGLMAWITAWGTKRERVRSGAVTFRQVTMVKNQQTLVSFSFLIFLLI